MFTITKVHVALDTCPRLVVGGVGEGESGTGAGLGVGVAGQGSDQCSWMFALCVA